MTPQGCPATGKPGQVCPSSDGYTYRWREGEWQRIGVTPPVRTDRKAARRRFWRGRS